MHRHALLPLALPLILAACGGGGGSGGNGGGISHPLDGPSLDFTSFSAVGANALIDFDESAATNSRPSATRAT
jgi:hypothetical protein